MEWDTQSFEQLKQFVIDNNIVGTSAGVCIALAAKDAIQSFTQDIVMPILVFILRKLHIDYLKKYLPNSRKSYLDIGSFIKEIISFVLIVVVSFLFIKVAFEYLLNIRITKTVITSPSIYSLPTLTPSTQHTPHSLQR